MATAATLLGLTPGVLGAQGLPVGDLLEDYVRMLELLGRSAPGTVTIRPITQWDGLSVADSVPHPWRGWTSEGGGGATGPDRLRLQADPARLRLFFNSDYPYGWNDGAVWQGVGLTAALDAGASATWGPLSVTVHPTLIWNHNGSFPIAEVNRPGGQAYGNPTRRIDLPQRFGPDAFWTLDPGQSSIRLTWKSVSAGFGTENLGWGPGVENAILMSGNAAGFPHGSLATARPVNVGIGSVEAQWIWGRLQSSQWTDNVPGLLDQYDLTEGRMITGAVASFRPRGMEEVTMGAARVYTLMVPRSGVSAGEYFLIFQRGTKDNFVTDDNPRGEDLRNQLISVFLRWAKPGSGFEAYVEWARDDHALDFRHLLLEPGHSQGYTIGFREAKPLSADRVISFQGEFTTLERGETAQLYGLSSYYESWSVPPGYTQRGQIIGASIGPGGNGQFVAADLFAPWGRAGVFLRRRVWDNDAYWERAAAEDLGICCHDVSIAGGVRSLALLDALAVGFEATLTKQFNRGRPWNDVWNVGLMTSFTQRRKRP